MTAEKRARRFKKIGKSRFVKINPSRGYGDGVFQILAENEQEYKLKDLNDGRVFEIYKAHCYRTFNKKLRENQ